MKILFLNKRVPFPADNGGKIRTLNVLKEFTKVALNQSVTKEDLLIPLYQKISSS